MILIDVQSPTPNSPPWVNITPSRWYPIFGQSVTFTATGSDQQDGAITNAQWFSSRDGSFGSGLQRTISTLSVGTHRIHASVTDSAGAKGGTYILYTVDPPSALGVPHGGGTVRLSSAPAPTPEVPVRLQRWVARAPNDPWNLRQLPLQIAVDGDTR